MAYASKLPDVKFDAIYDQLQALAKSSLDKCTSMKEGFFPNPWVKVINLWTVDRISNLAVYDMVKLEQVCMQIEWMPYGETLLRQAPPISF